MSAIPERPPIEVSSYSDFVGLISRQLENTAILSTASSFYKNLQQPNRGSDPFASPEPHHPQRLQGADELALLPDIAPEHLIGKRQELPVLLLLEFFDRRLGTSLALRPFVSKWTQQQSASGLPTIVHAACDPSLILQTMPHSEAAGASAQAFHLYLRIFKVFSSGPFTLSPAVLVFLLKPASNSNTTLTSSGVVMTHATAALMRSEVLGCVEGVDVPTIETILKQASTRWLQHHDVESRHGLLGRSSDATLPPAISSILAQRRRSRCAFLLQCAWRRHQQRGRIGDWVDGNFYTHAELAAIAKKKAEAVEAANQIKRAQEKAANLLVRVWRGFVGRKAARHWKNQVKKNPKLKAMFARRKVKRGGLYLQIPREEPPTARTWINYLPPNIEHKLRLLVRVSLVMKKQGIPHLHAAIPVVLQGEDRAEALNKAKSVV